MSSRDITIYDIAKALNVSPATVSRGLKDHPGIRKDTKKKIQEAAQKMGYQHNTFASSLRRKHTNTIGVIINRISSYFMAAVVSGMEKVANSNGYNLIISQTDESYQKEINSVKTLFNSRVDGLMVSLAHDTKKTDHFDIFLNKKIPLIFFDRVIDLPGCTSIVIDNKRAGYEATMHLIEQGCKRIVHLDGNVNRNVYADRLAGYREALAEKGIPFDPALVIYSSLTDQEAAEAAQSMLRMKKMPDGIFAANDISAVACIRELKAANIDVPGTIAVVGFNNDPISRVIEPNLTTIDYPGREIGEVAATMLINHLKKAESHVSTVVLTHKLIVRASSLRKNRTNGLA
jgi:LacI family transcriptional regulator